MKDFKQTTKMKAEGSHYKTGGKVKKFDDGGSTSSLGTMTDGSYSPNKMVYDTDFESAQSDYRKYRNASDPTTSQMSYLLGRKDTADKAWKTRGEAQTRKAESSRLGGDNAGLGRGHTQGKKRGGSIKKKR